MQDQPVIKINLKDEAFSEFSSGKKKEKTADAFMPSDIAVHPTTGDIYIIEGKNPKLMIMDSKQAIKNLFELDKNEFEQPEGITFSPSGELFISNEGAKKQGNIIKLELTKN
jgi:hypothetical protein